MNPTKRLSGVCSECGGPIQFPAELVGTMAQCPRCRKQTELILAPPPEESSGSRKALVLAAVAIGVLVLALVVALVGLKHFEKLAALQKDPAVLKARVKDSAGAAGFEVSALSLEKGQGSNMVYVVATVVNASGRQRKRVNVEFYLLDIDGRNVAIARAFRPTLDPGAKWQIKLPVEVSSPAVSARLESIREGD